MQQSMPEPCKINAENSIAYTQAPCVQFTDTCHSPGLSKVFCMDDLCGTTIIAAFSTRRKPHPSSFTPPACLLVSEDPGQVLTSYVLRVRIESWNEGSLSLLHARHLFSLPNYPLDHTKLSPGTRHAFIYKYMRTKNGNECPPPANRLKVNFRKITDSVEHRGKIRPAIMSYDAGRPMSTIDIRYQRSRPPAHIRRGTKKIKMVRSVQLTEDRRESEQDEGQPSCTATARNSERSKHTNGYGHRARRTMGQARVRTPSFCAHPMRTEHAFWRLPEDNALRSQQDGRRPPLT